MNTVSSCPESFAESMTGRSMINTSYSDSRDLLRYVGFGSKNEEYEQYFWWKHITDIGWWYWLLPLIIAKFWNPAQLTIVDPVFEKDKSEAIALNLLLVSRNRDNSIRKFKQLRSLLDNLPLLEWYSVSDLVNSNRNLKRKIGVFGTMIRALKSWKGADFNGKVKFNKSVWQCLMWISDGSQDIVFLTNVLYQMPYPNLALYNANQILKPDGKIIISEFPNTPLWESFLATQWIELYQDEDTTHIYVVLRKWDFKKINFPTEN